MRWTLAAQTTIARQADGEVVWSRYLDADINLPMVLTRHGGDGGKKARSPGRSRRKPLKPLRGECRVIPAQPW
jgi:hypothetical protein